MITIDRHPACIHQLTKQKLYTAVACPAAQVLNELFSSLAYDDVAHRRHTFTHAALSLVFHNIIINGKLDSTKSLVMSSHLGVQACAGLPTRHTLEQGVDTLKWQVQMPKADSAVPAQRSRQRASLHEKTSRCLPYNQQEQGSHEQGEAHKAYHYI